MAVIESPVHRPVHVHTGHSPTHGQHLPGHFTPIHGQDGTRIGHLITTYRHPDQIGLVHKNISPNHRGPIHHHDHLQPNLEKSNFEHPEDGEIHSEVGKNKTFFALLQDHPLIGSAGVPTPVLSAKSPITPALRHGLTLYEIPSNNPNQPVHQSMTPNMRTPVHATLLAQPLPRMPMTPQQASYGSTVDNKIKWPLRRTPFVQVPGPHLLPIDHSPEESRSHRNHVLPHEIGHGGPGEVRIQGNLLVHTHHTVNAVPIMAPADHNSPLNRHGVYDGLSPPTTPPCFVRKGNLTLKRDTRRQP